MVRGPRVYPETDGGGSSKGSPLASAACRRSHDCSQRWLASAVPLSTPRATPWASCFWITGVTQRTLSASYVITMAPPAVVRGRFNIMAVTTTGTVATPKFCRISGAARMNHPAASVFSGLLLSFRHTTVAVAATALGCLLGRRRLRGVGVVSGQHGLQRVGQDFDLVQVPADGPRAQRFLVEVDVEAVGDGEPIG